MKPPTWTDAELLAHNFDLLDRPDGDPDLSRSKPPANAEIRFIHSYNITPPPKLPNRLSIQPFVWCALCQEPTHWKGWVAEVVGTGRRCLIGQNCARKNGGEVIRLAASSFNAARDRAYVLRARQAVTPMLEHVRRSLEQWSLSPGVSAVLTWRAGLKAIAEGHTLQLTRAAALSPPVLLLEVQVRDRAAEEKRDRRRAGGGDPIYRPDWKPVGRIEGPALYAGPPPNVRIRMMLEKVSAAAGFLGRPTDNIRTRELASALLALRDVVSAARELEVTFAGYEKGLSDKSVDLVLGWFNQLRGEGLKGGFTREGRKVSVRSWAYLKPLTLEIPTPSPISCPPIIEQLSAALRGHDVAVETLAT